MTSLSVHIPAASIGSLVAGDRVRVAYGVFGRFGHVRSTSPGHVLVHYDDGSRELIEASRRPIWILR